jgi:hypothetical protein
VDSVDPATALSMARNSAWVIGSVWRSLMWILRRKDTPIFGIEWRFYDSEPTEGNSVGIARFERTWRWSIRGKWIRTRERSALRDTRRPYEGSGYLRDRRLVLCWAAADRPDTLGALVLVVDEDCREMKGYTVYTPQDAGVTVTLPIWFKRS